MADIVYSMLDIHYGAIVGFKKNLSIWFVSTCFEKQVIPKKTSTNFDYYYIFTFIYCINCELVAEYVFFFFFA